MNDTKEKPKRVRRSQKALSVANELIDALKHDKPINLQKLAVSKGYSKKSAIAQKPYQTDTFKDAVYPVIATMKHLHYKALQDLNSRDLSSERMDSVINLSRQMVHDTQLLEGKSTENLAVQVVAYGSDDFLAMQEAKHDNGAK